jgi:hypothetical protein
MRITFEIGDDDAERLFDAAEAAGVRIDTFVAGALRKALLAPPASRVEQVREREEQVRALHARRYSDIETAAHLGISINGARNIRVRLGLAANGRPGPAMTRKAS